MRARFLIVDDNDLVRNSLSAIVTADPEWEVCGAVSNGLDAIKAFKELKPDVVIVDFYMPGINGLETARRILELTRAVPILMFTDHASAELESHALQVGIRAVVPKIDTFLMVGIIKAILGPLIPPQAPTNQRKASISPPKTNSPL